LPAQDILAWARTKPNGRAVVYQDQALTYAEFANCLTQSARFFKSYPLEPGSTAVIVIDNLLVCWLTLFALRGLGLDTITVQSLEQARALRVRNVACVVFAERERDKIGTDRELDGAPTIIFPDAFILRARGVSSSPAGLFADRIGGHYLYTSGTTGTYKRLLFEADSAERGSGVTDRELSLNPETIYHNLFFPPFTGAGFKWPLFVWQRGGCVIFDQRGEALLDIFNHDITVTVAVPAMLEKLLTLLEQHPRRRGNFRLFTGGSFVSHRLAERVRDLVTPDVTVLYSSSECSTMAGAKFNTVEDLVWLTPAQGRTLKIVREDGSICGIDEEGDLGVLVTEHDRRGYADDPLIPVSWGELIDKITILEIKAMRIPDAEAKARVSTELALLLQVAGNILETSPRIAELKDALRSTNDRLWDVEDRLRLKERDQAFDAEFVELARSVYRLNDQRFLQKREMDRCQSSTFSEQKYFSSGGW
jgi:acyl-CoA synthetase (AMP-forming)/AMP-acid ligase II